MTAEAVVMNKTAVAMAADSAVTVSQEKVFNSASKVFALSREHPVGIMIHGQAEFMGIPWETLVKLYREEHGSRRRDALQEYAEAFIQYLRDHPHLFPEEQQLAYVRGRVEALLQIISRRVSESGNRELQDRAAAGEELSQDDHLEAFRRHAEKVVNEHYELFQSLENVVVRPEETEDIRARYEHLITELVLEYFGPLGISDKVVTALKACAVEAVKRPVVPGCPWGWSGVVVVGFGEQDIFPRLRALSVWGMAADHLLCSPFTHEDADIGFDNPAAIIPFAQRDMIHTFMEGVDPGYQEFVEKALSATLGGFLDGVIAALSDVIGEHTDAVRAALVESKDRELQDLLERLREYRQEKQIWPVIEVVGSLPKSELAELAEALVSLTSLKRRVTDVQETVGGPVDVAVISKGDGLVWVKRKHYFPGELNPAFLARYAERERNG